MESARSERDWRGCGQGRTMHWANGQTMRTRKNRLHQKVRRFQVKNGSSAYPSSV